MTTDLDSVDIKSPFKARPIKIALLISGHTRRALQNQSELAHIQQLLQRKFGSCDIFGVFPNHNELSTETWHNSLEKVKPIQQGEIEALCDFTDIRFYNDQLLFQGVSGKWGATRIDTRSVRSMWWAVRECFLFAESRETHYDWYIRLRPDNYKWGLRYTAWLCSFLKSFRFRDRSPRLVSVSPLPETGDDVCFVAPSSVLAAVLKELHSHFEQWSTDHRVANHPEFVVPSICKELGVPYDQFRFKNGVPVHTSWRWYHYQ